MSVSLLTFQQQKLLQDLFKVLILIFEAAPNVEGMYPNFVFGCYADLIITYGDRLFAIKTSNDYERNFGSLRDDVLNLLRSAIIFTNRNEPPPSEVFDVLPNRIQH